MTNEEKIQGAIEMLQQIKLNRDTSWLSAAMMIDEVIKLLRSPSSVVPGQNAASSRPRAGLSDRLIALIGKPSRNTRAVKTQKLKA